MTAADRCFLAAGRIRDLRSPDVDRSSRSSPDIRFFEFGCLASCLAPLVLVNGGRADRSVAADGSAKRTGHWHLDLQGFLLAAEDLAGFVEQSSQLSIGMR